MAKTLAENIAALTEAVNDSTEELAHFDTTGLIYALNDHAEALNRFCDVMAGEQPVIYSAPTAGA